MSTVSLKELVRRVMSQQVLGVTNERVVLVVDSVALRLVSSSYTLTELSQGTVVVVEDIAKLRKHLPFQAVYLCMPTPQVRAASPSPALITAHLPYSRPW